MMRITPVGLAVTLAVGAGLGVSAAGGGNGAVVIRDQGCVLFDGSGAFVFADTSHAVITKRGQNLVCRAKGLANPTRRTVRFTKASTGLDCFTSSGQTPRWHETLSASGNATLVCHVRQ